MSNILSILYGKNDTLDVNYVCIVQNVFLVFYNASSLKQHIMGRHVAKHKHIKHDDLFSLDPNIYIVIMLCIINFEDTV